ncbi:hypothetical protein [Candidatus Poriferisodalis sp.]|uniref:hypothetical protein n=1 Tax=Candidatus Poriferisodalis sp. TaxID=3101277 RepID=UPI003B01A4DB
MVDKDYLRRPNDDFEIGDKLVARVAVSEVAAHAYRSSKRTSRGNEATVVLARPSHQPGDDHYEIRLIPVRARARGIPFDEVDKPEPNRWLEWMIISPTRPLTDPSGPGDYLDVPSSAFWLFARADPQADIAASTRKGWLKIPGMRLAHAYGSTVGKGLASLVLKLLVLASFVIPLRNVDIPKAPSLSTADLGQFMVETFQFVAALIVTALMFKALSAAVSRRYRIEPPFAKVPVRHKWIAEGAMVTKELLWPGSTRRALALGNRLRGVDYWRQFVFDTLEPLKFSVKNAFVRAWNDFRRALRF